MSRFAIICATALWAAFAFCAHAGDQSVTVKFKPATTSATFSNFIKGYAAVNYFLEANAGQSMRVSFAKNRNSCEFHVMSPTGRDIFTDDYSVPGAFSARLQETGKYRIVAYLMRASARRGASCKFSITFDIKD